MKKLSLGEKVVLEEISNCFSSVLTHTRQCGIVSRI